MRIVIDLQAVQSEASSRRGIGRYSIELAKAMCRNRSGHEILFFLRAPAGSEDSLCVNKDIADLSECIYWRAPHDVAEFDNSPQSARNRSENEHSRELALARLNADWVHVSSLFETHENAVATIASRESRKWQTSVTLYDLIPLVYQTHYLQHEATKQWYFSKLEHLKRADVALAISDHSRDEAVEQLGLTRENVIAIHGGVDDSFIKTRQPLSDVNLAVKYGIERPYIMYTGGIDHRKNIDRLIKAFSLLPKEIRSGLHLVIVCKVLPQEKLLLHEVGRDGGLSDRDLIVTGFVPEVDLRALYRHARLFVFPSWHEGFGLPVLEAMASGLPVVAANAASLREIVEWPGALFDPYQVEDIARLLKRGATDEPFRAELVANGEQRLKQYSWDFTGRAAIKALEGRTF